MAVLSSFFSYMLLLVGYVSNNKYAMLASSRVVLISLNLEILLSFFLLFFAMISNALA